MPAPAPRATCPRRTGPRGGGRRLLPGLHQPHLRQPPLARARALAGGGDARRLRACRAAAVDPARRRRALLLDPVELEGLPRGPATDGAADGRGGAALDARGGAAARRPTPARAPRRWPGESWARRWTSGLRERLAAVRVIDPIEWIHERLLGSLRSAGALGRWPCIGPVRPSRAGSTRRLREIAGRPRRGGDRAARPRAAAGWPATAGCCIPSCPRRPSPTAPRELSGREVDACVSCNRTCELALEGVTGRPYESIVMTLERLTRDGPGGEQRHRRPLAGRL